MRLASLVEDLVDAASLSAGGARMNRERMDLRASVLSIGDRHGELVRGRGHGVRLEVDAGPSVPAWVHADSGRVMQVLDNLVVNAVRHAAAESTVTVRLAPGIRRGGREIEVINRGDGIPADVASTMFEPFTQGAGLRGRLGMGLAIAHGIALAHGGALRCEQQAWETCTEVRFVLRLPASFARRTRRTSPGFAASPGRVEAVAQRADVRGAQ
jgi:signal transduction histidine kinase